MTREEYHAHKAQQERRRQIERRGYEAAKGPLDLPLLLLTLLLDSYCARWHWLSWAGCTLYAATDEIHQLFVAGRTGKWQDVLLDSSGALAGLLLAMFMLWLIRRRRTKKQST